MIIVNVHLTPGQADLIAYLSHLVVYKTHNMSMRNPNKPHCDRLCRLVDASVPLA